MADAPNVSPEAKEFLLRSVQTPKDFTNAFGQIGFGCDTSIMSMSGHLVKCDTRLALEESLVAADNAYLQPYIESGIELEGVMPGELICESDVVSELHSDSVEFFYRELDIPYNLETATDMDHRFLTSEEEIRFRIIPTLLFSKS